MWLPIPCRKRIQVLGTGRTWLDRHIDGLFVMSNLGKWMGYDLGDSVGDGPGCVTAGIVEERDTRNRFASLSLAPASYLRRLRAPPRAR